MKSQIKKPNRAGFILLVAILFAQAWALPSAFGQSDISPVTGLEFEDGLLSEPWSDPIERFGLVEEPLAPIPDFDFDELSVSAVLAEGVGSQSVDIDVDVSVESERHLLALQAVATAELARTTVDDNIASAETGIAQATRGIASARSSIERTEDDIDEAEVELGVIDAADRDEADEQARLTGEIDQRQSAIIEIAVKAFTGEDLELETMLLDPESTAVPERRVVIGQVREIHTQEIMEFERLHRESQDRRDQLAAERAPIQAAVDGWVVDIVNFNAEIDDHIEDRVNLRAEIVDLEERGEELDVTIEDTLAFTEATAAQYQVAFHQRLDAFVAGTDIPLVALNAYVRASRTLATEDPSCGIHWSQLAGIGRIESFHGYFGSSTLDVEGNTTTDILGLPLDGRVLGGTVTGDLPAATGRTQETAGVQRLALILDSDNGVLDGDRTFDRAVGPMQFIPTTWALYDSDGNGDGQRDPQNIYDASLAAARYLCDAPGSMLTSSGEQRAYFAYNHDLTYSANVTRAGRGYHNQLDVSPESSSFASFARLPIPTPTTTVPVQVEESASGDEDEALLTESTDEDAAPIPETGEVAPVEAEVLSEVLEPEAPAADPAPEPTPDAGEPATAPEVTDG